MRDGRPVSSTSSGSVRLRSSEALVAGVRMRASDRVRSGNSAAVARRAGRVRERLCAAPRLAASRHLRYLARPGIVPTPGIAPAQERQGSCYARRAHSSRARVLVVGGGRSGEPSVRRSSESRPNRRSAVGVRQCGKCHRAGRQPTRQLRRGSQTRARSGAPACVDRFAAAGQSAAF